MRNDSETMFIEDCEQMGKKIRLLFLIQSLPVGGTEVALFNLLSAIDMDRFDITVYMYWASGGFYHTFKDMADKRGIKVRKMFNDMRSGKTLFEKLKNLYLLHIVEPQKLTRPRRFYKAAIEGEYDIEIAYTFFGTPIIIAASQNKNSKKVAWIHGDMHTNSWCSKYYKSHKEQAENYRQYDKIVCVSETVRDAFVKVLGENPALTVIHNPIDVNHIRELALEGLDKNEGFVDERTVCAVGRLSEEKGYDRLIKIHKQLVDEGAWHKLIIVGDGPLKETLENMASDLNVQETVRFVGYDLNPYRYITRCRFLVCSSYSEGLPVVLQEALALGRPVVSSHPSAEELFCGKVCGIVSGVDDASLKAGMKKMLMDKEFYQNCVAQAQAVGGQMNYGSMVKAVEKMFESLV